MGDYNKAKRELKMKFEYIRNGKLTSLGNQLNAVSQGERRVKRLIRFLSGTGGKKETHG